MTQRNYLIVALDASLSAPGIVFKTLISHMAESCRITLLTENADTVVSENPGIRIIPLHHAMEGWGKAKLKWKYLGSNARDRRWAFKSFRKNRKTILSERYDAIIVLTSNGYYSALYLGKILSETIHCPYIIYSVDGMPSPLPWLGEDERLHRNISLEIDRLCSGANLFILSNPMMLGYQKTILKSYRGRWDYLFTPYRSLPKDFSLKPHQNFNILYAGSLYGLRKIDGLTDAFRTFLGIRPDARLIIVGEVWRQYKEYAKDLVQEGKLVFKSPTLEINKYYSEADCLIDIAADIPNDVFLSSKVICYLPYSIPILAISGENSPVSGIMGGIGSILQCRNDAKEILEALVKAQDIHDFSDRRDLLSRFNDANLAKHFLSQIESSFVKEQLIVSMTSWAPRFKNLPTVLDSIFSQSLTPDKVVLNIGVDEHVPESIQEYLDIHNVEINRVIDTKVYKKLIPTLLKYPEACVVSIDDDWIYPRGMLEEFMRIHQQNPHNPISGNRQRSFHMSCHCGCASLTKREFFGDYLDMVDADLMANCPSDDMTYTFMARKNGYEYIRTENLYYENMTPYNPAESYSNVEGNPVFRSWEYLSERFGAPEYSPFKSMMYKAVPWIFEINRDRDNRKYIRVLGMRFYL